MSSITLKPRSKFVLKDDTSYTNNNAGSTIYFENTGSIWFHDLPVNVLINIFQYFDEEELRKYIIPVCQHWKYVALNPVLWKHLTIRGTHLPLYFICKQIRMFSQLESVFIDNIIEPVTVIRQICRCLPRIKHLSIRYCSPIPETAIRFIINACPLIESLDLCGTGIRGDFTYQSLCKLRNLKKLNLSDNPSLCVKSLTTVVLNCSNLKDLRISKFSNKNDEFKGEDVVLILVSLSEKLTSLSMDCTSLSSTAIETILTCKNLNRLGLYGATNLTGSQFITIWEKFPNLKQMKIRNAHQIGDNHIAELFTQGQSVMKNLVYLDFSGCFRIKDDSIEVVAECCDKLQHLGLKACKSITNLNSMITRNPKLEVLNIAFMVNLDVDSLLPLPAKLKKLFIDDCRVYEEWLVALRKERKNVKILICESEYNKFVSNINVSINK